METRSTQTHASRDPKRGCLQETMDQKTICTNILHHINALRLQDSFCDATLFVDGHTFPVHKTILVATSAFFSALMSDQDNVIYQVNGIKSEDFVHVLDFLYTGQIRIDSTNHLLYKSIAEQLKIDTMLKVCECFEQDNMKKLSLKTSQLANALQGKATNQNYDTFIDNENDYQFENAIHDATAEVLELQQPEDFLIQHGLPAPDESNKLEIISSYSAENNGETQLASSIEDVNSQRNAAIVNQLQPMELQSIKLADTTSSCVVTEAADTDIEMRIQSLEESDCINPDEVQPEESLQPSTNSEDEKTGFKCEWCGVLYKTMASLRHHCKENHAAKMYKCTFCPRTFVLAGQLERHVDHCRLTSTEDGRFTCPQCDYTSKKQSLVVQHYRKEHTSKMLNVCTICGVAFNGKLLFYEHQLKDHDVDVNDIKCKVHVCEFCDFKTVKLHSFKVHYQGHKTAKFQCEVCKLVCNSEITLTKHKKNIHENNVLYKCTICNYTSKYKATLHSHAYRVHKVVSTNKQKVFYCPYCDFSHIEQANLRKHERQCHSDEKHFQCTQCPKKFKHKAQLNIHERIHSGVRPFPCELCEYKAQSKPALLVHVRHSHSNEKKYICEFCGFATKGPSNLLSHKRRCKSSVAGIPAQTVCVVESPGPVYNESNLCPDLPANVLEAVQEMF